MCRKAHQSLKSLTFSFSRDVRHAGGPSVVCKAYAVLMEKVCRDAQGMTDDAFRSPLMESTVVVCIGPEAPTSLTSLVPATLRDAIAQRDVVEIARKGL